MQEYNSVALDHVIHDFGQRVTAPSEEEFVDTLQKLQNHVSQELEKQGDSPQFAKAWLLNVLVTELLKYSIEDDYVNLGPLRSTAATALQALASDESRIDEHLKSFLEVCRDLNNHTITPEQIEIESESGNESFFFTGRLAPPNAPPILVSSQRYDFVPVLEDSIANPGNTQGVIQAFVKNIRELRDKDNVSLDALYFIEKSVGPVGAISMVSSLVNELNLPASILRSNHWPSRTKVAGYQPKSRDKLVLVYDLCVTGDGIIQAAKELKARYNADVVGAVVLLAYGDRKDKLYADGKTIHLKAIGWADSFAREIQDLKTNDISRTKHIKLLTSTRRNALSPGDSRETALSPKGETEMRNSAGNGSRVLTWKDTLKYWVVCVAEWMGWLTSLDESELKAYFRWYHSFRSTSRSKL